MKLTRKMLNDMEKSLMIFLTREQRAIMLCWFSVESRYGWERDDFIHGFYKVLRYYPDHRNLELILSKRSAFVQMRLDDSF